MIVQAKVGQAWIDICVVGLADQQQVAATELIELRDDAFGRRARVEAHVRHAQLAAGQQRDHVGQATTGHERQVRRVGQAMAAQLFTQPEYLLMQLPIGKTVALVDDRHGVGGLQADRLKSAKHLGRWPVVRIHRAALGA